MARFDKVDETDKPEENFDSGAVRDSREGKGRFDLISPFVMKRLAIHFANGSVRYSPRNWERGIPTSRFLDSAMRHLNTYLQDKLLGQEHKEDHLAAALWNIHCIIHNEEMVEAGYLDSKFLDIPTYKKVKE